MRSASAPDHKLCIFATAPRSAARVRWTAR